MNTCKPLLISVAIGLSLALVSPVFADNPPVGFVKTVSGKAWVNTAGQSVVAKPGTAVVLGSQLKTDKGGSMGVTFKDNTVMSFGPDTELTVDEYLYAPSQGKLKLGTSLGKGTLNYVSGLIAKLQPEAVTVTTPGGTIGVGEPNS